MEVVDNKHFAVVVEATAGSDLDKALVVVAVVAVAVEQQRSLPSARPRSSAAF